VCNDAFPLVPLVRSDAVLYRCCVRSCVTAVLHSLEFAKTTRQVCLLTLANSAKIDETKRCPSAPQRWNFNVADAR